ncbi:hypothetical protein GCM10028805_06790 [Spirosoma harenae]
MKNLLIAICFACMVGSVQAQKTVAVSNGDINASNYAIDEAAIRKVIADESEAFFTKNREKWASHWAHEPYVSWTAQGGATSILTQASWDAYSHMFEGYFNDPTPGPATTFKRDNMQVTIVDKAATVTFLQTRQRAGYGNDLFPLRQQHQKLYGYVCDEYARRRLAEL